MSELRQAIRLQSYGNNKPIDVYKQESLPMFEDMISAIPVSYTHLDVYKRQQ